MPLPPSQSQSQSPSQSLSTSLLSEISTLYKSSLYSSTITLALATLSMLDVDVKADVESQSALSSSRNKIRCKSTLNEYIANSFFMLCEYKRATSYYDKVTLNSTTPMSFLNMSGSKLKSLECRLYVLDGRSGSGSSFKYELCGVINEVTVLLNCVCKHVLNLQSNSSTDTDTNTNSKSTTSISISKHQYAKHTLPIYITLIKSYILLNSPTHYKPFAHALSKFIRTHPSACIELFIPEVSTKPSNNGSSYGDIKSMYIQGITKILPATQILNALNRGIGIVSTPTPSYMYIKQLVLPLITNGIADIPNVTSTAVIPHLRMQALHNLLVDDDPGASIATFTKLRSLDPSNVSFNGVDWYCYGLSISENVNVNVNANANVNALKVINKLAHELLASEGKDCKEAWVCLAVYYRLHSLAYPTITSTTGNTDTVDGKNKNEPTNNSGDKKNMSKPNVKSLNKSYTLILKALSISDSEHAVLSHLILGELLLAYSIYNIPVPSVPASLSLSYGSVVRSAFDEFTIAKRNINVNIGVGIDSVIVDRLILLSLSPFHTTPTTPTTPTEQSNTKTKNERMHKLNDIVTRVKSSIKKRPNSSEGYGLLGYTLFYKSSLLEEAGGGGGGSAGSDVNDLKDKARRYFGKCIDLFTSSSSVNVKVSSSSTSSGGSGGGGPHWSWITTISLINLIHILITPSLPPSNNHHDNPNMNPNTTKSLNQATAILKRTIHILESTPCITFGSQPSIYCSTHTLTPLTPQIIAKPTCVHSPHYPTSTSASTSTSSTGMSKRDEILSVLRCYLGYTHNLSGDVDGGMDVYVGGLISVGGSLGCCGGLEGGLVGLIGGFDDDDDENEDEEEEEEEEEGSYNASVEEEDYNVNAVENGDMEEEEEEGEEGRQ